MARSKDVDAFIETAPKEVQPRLEELRTAIREAAPGAVESISYGMPFYSFRGESGLQARLCYFGFLKKKAVFYTRPTFLEEFMGEVEPYMSTKSALHFRLDGPVPIQLIKKLVRNGVKKHTAKENAGRKPSASRSKSGGANPSIVSSRR